MRLNSVVRREYRGGTTKENIELIANCFKMPIRSDWHIHSRNSCDGACLSVRELVKQVQGKGIVDFGLADHLHTHYNLPDIANSRKEFLANNPAAHFHFGIEVSCVSQWELDEIATGKYDHLVYGLREGGPAGGKLAIGPLG